MLGILLVGCQGENLVDPNPQRVSERAPIAGRARIVFFGDSITEGGVFPTGYVTIFARSIQFLNPTFDIEVMGSGKEGNRVTHLEKRLDKDVLSKKPTHVVIFVGVNDVGRPPPPGGNTGVAQYRRGLGELVARIENSGAEAVICTPSVIGEDPSAATDVNQLLDEYAEVARQVAEASGSRLCDLRTAFTGYLKRFNPEGRYEGILTSDGIHLNESGNRFVARQILHTFNDVFDDPQGPSGP